MSLYKRLISHVVWLSQGESGAKPGKSALSSDGRQPADLLQLLISKLTCLTVDLPDFLSSSSILNSVNLLRFFTLPKLLIEEYVFLS